FKPKPKEADGTRRMYQEDVDRVQEFHKCIECFLCQDVCHVIRDHEENKPSFSGPRFFVRLAGLEMHPLDTNDRLELIRAKHGLGFCNITKCCTEVCPEDIHITDNAIIPLKERVVTRHYDPIAWAMRRPRRPSRAARCPHRAVTASTIACVRRGSSPSRASSARRSGPSSVGSRPRCSSRAT